MSGRDINAITADLSGDLHQLDQYLDAKSLVLNPQKTQFIVICRPSHDIGIPANTSLSLNGVAITRTEQVKYLGLIIDYHLSFEAQVDNVCTQIDKKLGGYRGGRELLDHAAKRSFYLSVLQSTLDYASVAYVHSLTQQLFDRLVVKSHVAMKKVFGLPRRTNTSFVLSHSKLSGLEQRL